MNKLSIVSRRIKGCKKTSLIIQSKRSGTSFESYMAKWNRPDRWRVEPYPIAEPYQQSQTGLFANIPRMDGGKWGGKNKMWTWHWRQTFGWATCGCIHVYCARQYIEYENLFTWGREEALAQMNYRSMRDEELIYLWVQYNKVKDGSISEDDIYRPEIKNDYGWDNIY